MYFNLVFYFLEFLFKLEKKGLREKFVKESKFGLVFGVEVCFLVECLIMK